MNSSDVKERIEKILDSIPIRGTMMDYGFKNATDALMSLFTEGMDKRLISEHMLIKDMTDESHSYEQNENGSGIQYFDNLRLERLTFIREGKGCVKNEPLLSIPRPENRRKLNLEPKEKK